jgi:hypothetical protein
VLLFRDSHGSQNTKVAEPMKERNEKKAPASHAKRVFQAPDVNNGVEEKMPNEREREKQYSDVSI